MPDWVRRYKSRFRVGKMTRSVRKVALSILGLSVLNLLCFFAIQPAQANGSSVPVATSQELAEMAKSIPDFWARSTLSAVVDRPDLPSQNQRIQYLFCAPSGAREKCWRIGSFSRSELVELRSLSEHFRLPIATAGETAALLATPALFASLFGLGIAIQNGHIPIGKLDLGTTSQTLVATGSLLFIGYGALAGAAYVSNIAKQFKLREDWRKLKKALTGADAGAWLSTPATHALKDRQAQAMVQFIQEIQRLDECGFVLGSQRPL